MPKYSEPLVSPRQRADEFPADLRPGIYMAEVKQGNNRKTIKLVKQ
jgi:hypothetical protein